MIVERWTFNVKEGCRDKLVEVLESENAPSWPHRLLRCLVGTRGRIVLESEFENMAAQQKAWEEWGKSPGRSQHREAVSSLTEGNTILEFWIVME